MREHEETKFTFKQKERDLCYQKDNHFKYNNDYKSVMQFISKNKTIPKKLEEFKKYENDQTNIKALLGSIKKGDLTNEIFHNPNCQLYALYLLEKENISITDFLTVNIYLSALMEYTTFQSLKKEELMEYMDLSENLDLSFEETDETNLELKKNCEITLITFNEVMNLFNNQLDKIGQIHKNVKINTELIINKFKNNELQEIDKNVIRIKKPENNALDLEELTNVMPFIFSDDIYYYIPTAGMMNAIQNTVNKHPIKMAPIFGNINSRTLYLMHQLRFHPINLYSIFVKSNPTSVHGMPKGPLWVILHDMGHIFIGNFCAENHYFFFYNYFIPKIAEVFKIDINNIEFINGLYDLIDLFFESDKNNLRLYLSRAFDTADQTTRKLCQTLYNDQDEIKKNYDIDFMNLLKDIFMNNSNSNKNNIYKPVITFLIDTIINDEHGKKALEDSGLLKLYDNGSISNYKEVGLSLIDTVMQIHKFNHLIFSDKELKRQGHAIDLKIRFDEIIRDIEKNTELEIKDNKTI
jgi:hypothetical protein